MYPPPTEKELREAVDSLVASGQLIRVEEIDPETGELQNRYFLPERAPKPH